MSEASDPVEDITRAVGRIDDNIAHWNWERTHVMIWLASYFLEAVDVNRLCEIGEFEPYAQARQWAYRHKQQHHDRITNGFEYIRQQCCKKGGEDE